MKTTLKMKMTSQIKMTWKTKTTKKEIKKCQISMKIKLYKLLPLQTGHCSFSCSYGVGEGGSRWVQADCVALNSEDLYQG